MDLYICGSDRGSLTFGIFNDGCPSLYGTDGVISTVNNVTRAFGKHLKKHGSPKVEKTKEIARERRATIAGIAVLGEKDVWTANLDHLSHYKDGISTYNIQRDSEWAKSIGYTGGIESWTNGLADNMDVLKDGETIVFPIYETASGRLNARGAVAVNSPLMTAWDDTKLPATAPNSWFKKTTSWSKKTSGHKYTYHHVQIISHCPHSSDNTYQRFILSADNVRNNTKIDGKYKFSGRVTHVQHVGSHLVAINYQSEYIMVIPFGADEMECSRWTSHG